MELFVPGRICLFGEHSDWAGGYRRNNDEIEKGYTIITGTNQGIYAQVESHPSSLILTSSTPEEENKNRVIPMTPMSLLEEAQKGGFWSYIAGVAYQVNINFGVGGLIINNYFTDLPIKKGLSSSAAICVLTARAFNRIYDLDLTVREEMELAYLGETTTPSRCGRMDQGCAYGNQPVLMIFDGDQVEIQKLQVEKEVYLVIADLKAGKNTRKILEALNQCYPIAESQIEQDVQKLFGSINKRIIQQAIEALEKSDEECLGRLMIEAQMLFDRFAMPVCPEELASPRLHHVLKYEPLIPHIWGGKGVGSQGDGAAQFITRSKIDQQAVIDILTHDLELPALELTIRPDQTITSQR